jgi:hypothetical protein
MTRKRDAVSQRLIRKGALVEETYMLFSSWHVGDTLEANFDRIFKGRFKTVAWEKEVKTTLRRRFRDIDAAMPLILASKNGLALDEWCNWLLLWIGIREQLYRDFALNWLFHEYESGRYQVRSEDVQSFVRSTWPRLSSKTIPLSDYGVVRGARDLVRMATDLGVLTGAGPQKTFSPLHLSDRSFLYYAHAIAEVELSTSSIPQSEFWQLALIRPTEVVEALLRLHQFRKLDYQVAGSLVQLTLPFESSRKYAERMVA